MEETYKERNVFRIVKDGVVLNEQRIKEMAAAYRSIKRIFEGDDNVSVSYEVNRPFIGNGSVSLRGKSLEFRNIYELLSVVTRADTFEVVPHTDGTIEMNLGFVGLAREVSI